MARTSVKSTYSLDVDTVRKLDQLAAHWHIPKSEALRRAIHLAARDQAATGASPLRALEELQKRVKARFTKREIESWAVETRRERMKSSERHEWPK
jgi:predicted transcriptional regulator